MIYSDKEVMILNDYYNRYSPPRVLGDGKPESCNDCQYADFDDQDGPPNCTFHVKCNYSEKYFLGSI